MPNITVETALQVALPRPSAAKFVAAVTDSAQPPSSAPSASPSASSFTEIEKTAVANGWHPRRRRLTLTPRGPGSFPPPQGAGPPAC
jgi:hypothetical protein